MNIETLSKAVKFQNSNQIGRHLQPPPHNKQTKIKNERMDKDQEIISTKQRGADIVAILQAVKELPPSREVSITITKLQESVMWLGMNLKRINEAAPGASPNPHPKQQRPVEHQNRTDSGRTEALK